MASLLQLAHARAARVAKLSGGSLLLGLSGKDSFVSLAIAAEHFKRIVCFNMYFVRGLRCNEVPLENVARRFGAELIYVPHFDMARMLKFGVLRPHIMGLRESATVKKADIERLARKRAGIEWIAYGERLSDSFARRLFWRKLDGVYEQGRRAALICDWLDKDVAGYMRAAKLPAPCRFGCNGRSSDFDLSPKVLTFLRDHHPDDYRRVLRVFPAAGAMLLGT